MNFSALRIFENRVFSCCIRGRLSVEFFPRSGLIVFQCGAL